MLSDCVRAFSGAPESTWSYGVAFRMLRDSNNRIVKLWSSGNLCTDLQETSTAALRETSRAGKTAAQYNGARDLGLYSHCGGTYITTRYFVISYLSLLHLQDLLHHNMACII